MSYEIIEKEGSELAIDIQHQIEEVGKLNVVCLRVMRGGTFKGIRERRCGELAARLRYSSGSSLRYCITVYDQHILKICFELDQALIKSQMTEPYSRICLTSEQYSALRGEIQ
ncbi:Uncharacterized protein FWK35_00009219 [Aphis craccivora]|uniref:Uncharacterized protein n=1 Tax=Aphis craccivora TaxID=307492 RepID=A0A6G0YI61_APHCR|nr:Uncharacterized protein FWK35_00009219 [Aphis craccivora]